MKFTAKIFLILILSAVLAGCSGKKNNDINKVSEEKNNTDISVQGDNFGGKGDRIKKS